MSSNEFVESLRNLNKEFPPVLREEIIAILKKEKTIKEVVDSHKLDEDFPKDPKGIKRAMKRLVEQDEEAKQLYSKYIQKANNRPRGYSYVPEIIDMLENDLSQREVAEKFGISRETIKTAIKRVKNDKLRELIKEHDARHSLGRNCPGITLEEERGIRKYKQEYLSKKAEVNTQLGNKTGEREQ